MRIASYRTTTTTTTNPTPIRLERNRKRKYQTLFFAKPYKRKTTENETIPVYKPNLVQIMQCIPSEQKSQIVILILANLLNCNKQTKNGLSQFLL